MTVPSRALLALLLGLPIACSGGGTGPGDPGETRILSVGVARNDASEGDNLEGYIVLFYDIDREVLLEANARVNDLPLEMAIEVNEGPIYLRGAAVRPDRTYALSAEVQTPEGVRTVTSQIVTPPEEFEIDAPATHRIDRSMTVTWDPIPGVTGINVAAGSGFDVDLPANATSVTIPASAFAGLTPGETIEIEVSPYDTFYVSFSSAISGVLDPEDFVDRFTDVENLTGARGVFGAATSVGAIVTLE